GQLDHGAILDSQRAPSVGFGLRATGFGQTPGILGLRPKSEVRSPKSRTRMHGTHVTRGCLMVADAALSGGNYEVLRARLAAAGAEAATRAVALNTRRKQLFGTTEPQLVATERVRTEHNCVPVDIVSVGDHLLVGFNVFLGLKAETELADVLALHQFERI